MTFFNLGFNIIDARFQEVQRGTVLQKHCWSKIIVSWYMKYYLSKKLQFPDNQEELIEKALKSSFNQEILKVVRKR